MRTIKEIEKDMDLVIVILDKLQEAMTLLIYERENLIAIQRGLEASAEIEAEQLIERIKQ